jgi:hypothetical protein
MNVVDAASEHWKLVGFKAATLVKFIKFLNDFEIILEAIFVILINYKLKILKI